MAKTGKQNRRDVVDQIRMQQKRADQRQGRIIIGACVAVALVIVGLAAYGPVKEWWDLRQYEDVALSDVGAAASVCQDVETEPANGSAEHVDPGTPVEYDQAPPAFGQHEVYPDEMGRKLYTASDRPNVEKLVHNLEHGYTILWYDETIAADDQEMEQIRAIADKLQGTDNMRLKFKAVPWTSEDGEAFPDDQHVAFTHWSKGGKDASAEDASAQVGVWQYCSEVSGEALDTFMIDYPYLDSPEPGAA
ncbi:DUF3105 domain-containing protein [Nocardioides donggukensis]|uniref:DUF3105 domain-containing protein n=1 Tax=Nocardioides donggukensis TaxID=2774019 RepID=A0A927Q0B9_9ACTN|nr:DUF3105 domain-containing protein [Nocardioides donggukensis]MBD8868727.1 DUF3105 domain-containing protein [Nocardioides donggukensis]